MWWGFFCSLPTVVRLFCGSLTNLSIVVLCFAFFLAIKAAKKERKKNKKFCKQFRTNWMCSLHILFQFLRIQCDNYGITFKPNECWKLCTWNRDQAKWISFIYRIDRMKHKIWWQINNNNKMKKSLNEIPLDIDRFCVCDMLKFSVYLSVCNISFLDYSFDRNVVW